MELRCGRIAYTNDLPIYAAFDAEAVRFPGTLRADVPAGLNAGLLNGEFDLSPISAFFYAKHPERFALLPELCIGSRREVWSVILVSSTPLDHLDGKTVTVTTESASGRNLLRVLLERRHGVRVRFAETEDPLGSALAGEPTLLIGDRAIEAQAAFPPERIHDLGLLWNEWTGTDMVYAVWAVRREVLATRRDEVAVALNALRAARAWGTAHPEQVILAAQAEHPRPAGFYDAYYRTLNFTFDAGAQAGLSRFFAELHAIGAIASCPSVDPEVTLAVG